MLGEAKWEGEDICWGGAQENNDNKRGATNC